MIEAIDLSLSARDLGTLTIKHKNAYRMTEAI